MKQQVIFKIEGKEIYSTIISLNSKNDIEVKESVKKVQDIEEQIINQYGTVPQVIFEPLEKQNMAS